MLGVLVVALLLIGRFHPGSGADVLDWKPARPLDAQAQDEQDDIEQMLAAQNERRRRRGLPDRTEEQVRAQVDADRRALDAYRRSVAEDRGAGEGGPRR